jgi:hypothetical protein
MLTIYSDKIYTVDDDGKISYSGSGSDKWKFIGLLPVRCIDLDRMIPHEEITAEWLKAHPLTFANGNPRYKVVDLDHGTYRTWGHPVVNITSTK